MIEEEFIKIFQNSDVELQTIDQKQIDQESIQESALRKIRMKELANMLKDLSWDDRYEWLLYQKNKGNKLFYQQQYDRAIQVYCYVINQFQFILQQLKIETSIKLSWGFLNQKKQQKQVQQLS